MIGRPHTATGNPPPEGLCETLQDEATQGVGNDTTKPIRAPLDTGIRR